MTYKKDQGAPAQESTIQLLERKVLYKGFNTLSRYHVRIQRYDKSWSEPIDREVLHRANSVVVLPYDPTRDEIVLVEQVRFGAYAAGVHSRQLEPVAGLADRDESLEDLARRETMEECGLKIAALFPVCNFLVSPGCMTEICHTFLGIVDTACGGGLYGNPDEGEDIRAHVLPLNEAEERLRAGEFQVGVTVLTLQWLLMNRERFKP